MACDRRRVDRGQDSHRSGRLSMTNEASSLYREVGKGEPVYLIVSRWQDEAAFKEFIASDAFKKVTNWGALNILSRRPQHTTYRHEESSRWPTPSCE
jgi:heme-degrading monooxygenase HmoA